METSESRVETAPLDVLNSATMRLGEAYVQLTGITLMLVWLAGNSDLLQLVRTMHSYIYLYTMLYSTSIHISQAVEL